MEGKEWVWDNGILKEAEVKELKLQADKNDRMKEQRLTLKSLRSFLKKL